jgi:hypothetical protein
MKTTSLFFHILVLASITMAGAEQAGKGLDDRAEEYVKLALAVGSYAPGYIDAYYGPTEWLVPEAAADEKRSFPAAELRLRAASLLKELEACGPDLPGMEALRAAFLRKQAAALKAEIDVLAGKKLAFDEESKAFYDTVAPVHCREEFEKALAALETALPGKGRLWERLAAFRNEYVIPADKLPAVFDAAIAECRRRTLARIALPPHESFKAVYVRDKPWSAYNWYKGGAFSVIEVNTDLPMDIDSPLGLASHEGYPGHHVYNSLLEQKLAKGRGWVEFAIYPLFSPESLIAEGTANYGIELIFPGDERQEFERNVLYPIAGLDPRKAGRFDQVQRLLKGLRYARNEGARGYLDGKMSKEAARDWLERYALESPERAAKTIDFWNHYRSYVITYVYGQDVVRGYVERTAGPNASLERKWQVFLEVLTTPRTPSGLAGE